MGAALECPANFEMGTNFLAGPAWHLLTALAAGLFIGAERERNKGTGAHRAAEGLRTFALISLGGGLCAQTQMPALVVLGGIFASSAALLGYWLNDRHDPGLTTECALFVAYVLGVLAQTQPALALGTSVVVVVLLAARKQLHHFVREALTEQELHDGLLFAIAALVVLPLVPNRAIDQIGGVNPFALWRLVVVLMGLSAAGYWSARVLGPRYGLMAAGFASGFVSSSIGIAGMSARAHQATSYIKGAAAGAIASILGSLFYLIALVATADLSLLWRLALPLAGTTVPTLGYALVKNAHVGTPTVNAPAGRAFNLKTVIVFSSLVILFASLSTLLVSRMGEQGLVFGALATGLVDAHAAAVAIATMAATGRVAPGSGALAILVALSVNMAIKIPATFALGPKRFAVQVSIGLVLVLLGLWGGYALGWGFFV
jgi:uncharacterized membrane protein (DUF4010 family)